MNRSKQKGTAWESRVVAYLKEKGFEYVERRTLSGALDKGDVAGIPGVVIECKNEKSHDLARYQDETAVETANAGALVGFAVFPRRSHHIGKAHVLMSFDQAIELIK